MKYIFTIATGVYYEFFNNFKNSINNFYPNEDKKLIVFSNKLQEYNNWKIGNTFIEIIDIPNMLYTSINLNKFNFIEWYCESKHVNDNDLVYYFDIDTYFYKDSINSQNILDNIIKEHNNSVIFSNHPYNLFIKNKNIGMYLHGLIDNKNFVPPTLPKIFNDYSFAKYNLWCRDCITSFFVGKLSSIKKLNKKFIDYYKEIIHTDKVLPEFREEDIVNYIWFKQLINDITEQYIYVTDDSLINCIYELENKTQIYAFDQLIDIDNYDFICNQKYNVKIKKPAQ